jgi:hypothetical protein
MQTQVNERLVQRDVSTCTRTVLTHVQVLEYLESAIRNDPAGSLFNKKMKTKFYIDYCTHHSYIRSTFCLRRFLE